MSITGLIMAAEDKYYESLKELNNINQRIEDLSISRNKTKYAMYNLEAKK